jgi:FAD/FMN-containing dehydrogenase
MRGDVEFDAVSRRLYATDAGLSQIEPLGVVSPRDAEDVARLTAYAAERGLSLVARGMGSGLNGAAVGAGIQVDFTRYMNTVLEVAPDASWVRVQPGVGMASLNRFLQPYGVFFAPDPSSENHCSLGGMIGTNASGPRSVAYGATKDHVLALQLVMADGSAFEARALPLDGPELAGLLEGDSLAGRAFASVLPAADGSGDDTGRHAAGRQELLRIPGRSGAR